MASSLVMLSAALLLGLLLPSSMADRNVLYGGQKLRIDEFLAEGDYKFIMQSDCNLVLYDKEQPLWSSYTSLGNGCFARMQTDGNLAIFNEHLNKVWESGTRGEEGEYILVLQRDGHVVIYGNPIFTVPEVEATNRKIAMAK